MRSFDHNIGVDITWGRHVWRGEGRNRGWIMKDARREEDALFDDLSCDRVPNLEFPPLHQRATLALHSDFIEQTPQRTEIFLVYSQMRTVSLLGHI